MIDGRLLACTDCVCPGRMKYLGAITLTRSPAARGRNPHRKRPTVGTVLSYVFYWLLAIAILVYLKFTEGRTTLLGRESAAGRARRVKREETHGQLQELSTHGAGDGEKAGAELPR